MRGATWFTALAGGQAPELRHSAAVWAADAALEGEHARFIAVVPDPANRFPRARHGEVGIEQARALALEVRAVIGQAMRPIVAIVDVRSQAYGRQEEVLGLHRACADAVAAYAEARRAGHPLIALIVGRAMSGAFLAHGYQANRILALDDPEVLVHAMSKEAAARVTRRTVAELEALGEEVLPMSYSIRAYEQLGLLHALIGGVNADAPSKDDVLRVKDELVRAVHDARQGPRDLSSRLASPQAHRTRAASLEVRRLMARQWNA
ncbi:biotin-independent malonate decarboxylase subunit gamma [Pendulispora brunnea]|uniref:Biotin-independent malonate decarboxylase subunit gamma n=1 Tax=Pendulispora brunnea TaxID=2905690 RepID=A0ABZ2KGL2_9BACT